MSNYTFWCRVSKIRSSRIQNFSMLSIFYEVVETNNIFIHLFASNINKIIYMLPLKLNVLIKTFTKEPWNSTCSRVVVEKLFFIYFFFFLKLSFVLGREFFPFFCVLIFLPSFRTFNSLFIWFLMTYKVKKS